MENITEKFGLKLRYINGQCYEFLLPNGKHLVTDPYITPTKGLSNAGFQEFTADNIEGADYILLTHAHYDHTSDLGLLAKKFDSYVFAGDLSAPGLGTFYDLDHGKIMPMTNLQTFEMEDFTLTAFRGKHAHSKPLFRDHSMSVTKNKWGIEGYGELDVLGAIETYDFCLTFKNNLRLMFVSGTPEMENPYTIARKFKPNVVIRHSVGKWDPAYYAALIDRFGAPVVFPAHHDNIYAARHNSRTMDEFTDMTNQALHTMGSATEFINPVPYRWYSLSMNVAAE